MKLKLTLTHITALMLLTASCASEDIGSAHQTLSGDGTKTPISVTALLDAGTAGQTRAADMAFANGDKLIAYLRHVTWNGGFTTDDADKRTVVTADQAPRLVNFTCTGSEAWNSSIDDILPFVTDKISMTGAGTTPNTQQAKGLAASYTNTQSTTTNGIFWDDFSQGAKGDNTDIRTDGHYLQSFYGYCYNGSPAKEQTGSCIETDLVEATGVLGWQVQTDQNDDALRHSDLLWSAEQTPIQYAHGTTTSATHGTLVLPYTHAMSKVTINVTVDKGFTTSFKLDNATITLHNMFTKCTCTAPTYKISSKGTSGGEGTTTDVTMHRGSTETAKKCTYEAVVVPSVLSVGNNLATISNMDGNTYLIPITEEMLQTPSNTNEKGWGNQLTEAPENIQDGTAQVRPRAINQGKGYAMKSGVNYVLNVNLDKQGITVSALIKDWENVEAEGRGEIQFNSDVTNKGDIADALKAKGFDVYKSSGNTAFSNKSTTVKWEVDKWTYAPAIYWAGQSDAAYFRALSSGTLPSGAQYNDVIQGNDILWGYACDIVGDKPTAEERTKIGTGNEATITPRTGDVPLFFEHVMSKITVNLKTADGDASLATSPAVNLAGATVGITKIAEWGCIDLKDGHVTNKSQENGALQENAPINGYPVVPQTIHHDAVMTITLSDGTKYSLKLKDCQATDGDGNVIKDDNDQPTCITQWQQGKHYTYTIYLEKEAITFRAMIKDWEEKTGSGNATLEWD